MTPPGHESASDNPNKGEPLTTIPDPSSPPGPVDPRAAGVTAALERAALDHLDIEPKARELERRLTVLFGEHPSGTRGWVSVERGADGVVSLAIADVALDRVLPITRRIDGIIDGEGDAPARSTTRASGPATFGVDGRPLPLHARRWGMR